MSINSRFLCSTIGLKFVMALSGLMISGFVLAHMAGNLLIFAGADAYNKYGHGLTSNPLIWVARAGLIAFFLSHIVNGFLVSFRNQKARPDRYAVSPTENKSASLASRTMIFQGVIILAFLILHLATFSLGKYYETTVDGVVMRDLFRLVVEVFQKPIYVVWYVVSLILVIIHLSHGFSSGFQTLGFHHPKYTPLLKIAGVIYGFVVGCGFIAVPVYIFLVKSSV